jgi:hypothetical protein
MVIKDYKLSYIKANGMFLDAEYIKKFFYPTQEDPYWHIELKNGVVYNVTGEVTAVFIDHTVPIGTIRRIL